MFFVSSRIFFSFFFSCLANKIILQRIFTIWNTEKRQETRTMSVRNKLLNWPTGYWLGLVASHLPVVWLDWRIGILTFLSTSLFPRRIWAKLIIPFLCPLVFGWPLLIRGNLKTKVESFINLGYWSLLWPSLHGPHNNTS